MSELWPEMLYIWSIIMPGICNTRHNGICSIFVNRAGNLFKPIQKNLHKEPKPLAAMVITNSNKYVAFFQNSRIWRNFFRHRKACSGIFVLGIEKGLVT